MEEDIVTYDFDGKEQERPEHSANLERMNSLSRSLQAKLHAVITLREELDRAAIENAIVRNDVHCMLSEIISTARLHNSSIGNPLRQLVVHHVCVILERITQQMEEITVLDDMENARWLPGWWRTSRMPVDELNMSFELLRCRFTRLLTVFAVWQSNSSSSSESDHDTLENIPLD